MHHPAIARFMRWEPPGSFNEYKAHRQARLQANDPSVFSFVLRRKDTMECLGIAGLDEADQPTPELGIWLKESGHGHGYGGEAVKAVAEWAMKNLATESFLYPVAVENLAIRRIAEKLKGEIVGTRRNPKYESVVYKICISPLPEDSERKTLGLTRRDHSCDRICYGQQTRVSERRGRWG